MTITREQGYAIEGDPKPIDDTAPERLRERREALGWNQTWAAEDINRLHGFTEDPWGWRCVASCEDGSASAIDRARYAAALSAAEAERPAKPDPLAYADSPVWDDGPLPTPTPERPAPRFKVGDWARDRDTVFRVAEMHWDDDRWYARPVAGVRDGIAEYSIQPASPPAPEVVDVPQPIVKRCACPDVHDDVEAEWRPGEPYLTVTHTTVPLALLRAMLEAIDAQQGGPPKKWGSLDWLDEPEPTRPEPRYKVGDWVRVVTGPLSSGRTDAIRVAGVTAAGYIIADGATWAAEHLTPAIDPALHETARKTVAWLRGEGPAPVVPLYDLPGYDEWASTISRAEWAAQLERLLGDAP